MNNFKQELHARERCSSVTVKTAEKQILEESVTSSFVVGHDNYLVYIFWDSMLRRNVQK